MTTQTTTQTTTITRRSRLQTDWNWAAEWRPLTAAELAECPLMSPAQVMSTHSPAWAHGSASPGGLGVTLTVYHRGKMLPHSGGEQGSLWEALGRLVDGDIDALEWPIAQEGATDED